MRFDFAFGRQNRLIFTVTDIVLWYPWINNWGRASQQHQQKISFEYSVIIFHNNSWRAFQDFSMMEIYIVIRIAPVVLSYSPTVTSSVEIQPQWSRIVIQAISHFTHIFHFTADGFSTSSTSSFQAATRETTWALQHSALLTSTQFTAQRSCKMSWVSRLSDDLHLKVCKRDSLDSLTFHVIFSFFSLCVESLCC